MILFALFTFAVSITEKEFEYKRYCRIAINNVDDFYKFREYEHFWNYTMLEERIDKMKENKIPEQNLQESYLETKLKTDDFKKLTSCTNFYLLTSTKSNNYLLSIFLEYENSERTQDPESPRKSAWIRLFKLYKNAVSIEKRDELRQELRDECKEGLKMIFEDDIDPLNFEYEYFFYKETSLYPTEIRQTVYFYLNKKMHEALKPLIGLRVILEKKINNFVDRYKSHAPSEYVSVFQNLKEDDEEPEVEEEPQQQQEEEEIQEEQQEEIQEEEPQEPEKKAKKGFKRILQKIKKRIDKLNE